MNASKALGYLYLTDAHYLLPLLAHSRPGSTPENPSDGQPDGRPDGQPENPSDGRPDGQPDSRPAEVPAGTRQPQPARVRKPKTLRVGKFIIGDDSCHGLGGHPGIRY